MNVIDRNVVATSLLAIALVGLLAPPTAALPVGPAEGGPVASLGALEDPARFSADGHHECVNVEDFEHVEVCTSDDPVGRACVAVFFTLDELLHPLCCNVTCTEP